MALILAYADITSTLVSDADGSPINVQSTSGVQTIDYSTAELRFSGRAFDRMDWTVGGFYYDGESVNNQVVSIPFLGFVANFPPFPFDDPSQQFVNTDNVHENNNESVFAHVVFDVTDKFAVTAGVRYSNDEKVVAFDNTRVQVPRVVVEGDNTDYKLGIDYQFTPDILAYASWSTGYRPGSYNPRPFQATQVVAVDAEDSEAYELGLKSDWFDRRLRTNLAVFYTDWKTRITPVGGTECLLIDVGPPPVYLPDDPNTPGSVTDSLGNVCEAVTSRTFYENTPGEVEGVEVEMSWEPVDGLVFSGVYGWIDWESPDINDDPNGDQRATAVRAGGQLGAERVLRLGPRQRSEPDAAAGLLRPGGDLLAERVHDIHVPGRKLHGCLRAAECTPGVAQPRATSGRSRWVPPTSRTRSTSTTSSTSRRSASRMRKASPVARASGM